MHPVLESRIPFWSVRVSILINWLIFKSGMWDTKRNTDNWRQAYSLIKIPWNFRGLIGYSSDPSAMRLEFWFQEKYSSILLELLVFNLELLFVFRPIHKMVHGKESFSRIRLVKMRSLWGAWRIWGKSQEKWSDNKRRNMTFGRSWQYWQRNRYFHVRRFSDFSITVFSMEFFSRNDLLHAAFRLSITSLTYF